MVDKLHEYQGLGGRFHEWRDNIRTRYTTWREENAQQSLMQLLISKFIPSPNTGLNTESNGLATSNEYSHVYRLVI